MEDFECLKVDILRVKGELKYENYNLAECEKKLQMSVGGKRGICFFCTSVCSGGECVLCLCMVPVSMTDHSSH